MAGHSSALIVSQSEQLRSSLTILLRSLPEIGNIHQASDAASALEGDPGLQPKLVLLDYELAQNGTAGTLAKFRARWPHALCLALTDDEGQVERALESGADVVLMKGVLAARLLDTVEGLLKA